MRDIDRVLRAVLDGSRTASEIVALTQITPHSVASYLSTLARIKRIRRDGRVKEGTHRRSVIYTPWPAALLK